MTAAVGSQAARHAEDAGDTALYDVVGRPDVIMALFDCRQSSHVVRPEGLQQMVALDPSSESPGDDVTDPHGITTALLLPVADEHDLSPHTPTVTPAPTCGRRLDRTHSGTVLAHVVAGPQA